MKPSSTNRQRPGLSGIRGQPTASPELRFGWMQATIRLLSERKGGEFFLDIPSYRAHRGQQRSRSCSSRHWNSRHVGEGCVFSTVIKLLRIDVAGLALLLPGDRSSYRFLDFNRFLVAQPRPDALGAGDHMLSRIAGLQ